MSSKPLAALAAAALWIPALCLSAQQPAPQPIQAMPYSPSLDVTSLDRSVDPCVDFYKFSCGGWKKNNPIPADQSGWSVYAKLGNENQQFLWGLLDAGMAQWACENERPENLRVSAVTNPHSPGFARINGVVSNMPEFQHAFSCKAGQPMVHVAACRVW
jgi:predicted metalloendopeptidase